MTAYMGIDPGAKGAIAVVGPELVIWDMPEEHAIVCAIQQLNAEHRIAFCCLETQQAMPKQGVVSMFKLGASYGYLKGVLDSLGIPWFAARAKEWQRDVGIPAKADKSVHVQVASRLFPTAELYGPKGGVKDGRADALLMAEYARRKCGR